MALKPDKQQVPISLPREIIERIDQAAAARYKTRAGYISDIVIEHVLSQLDATSTKKEDG